MNAGKIASGSVCSTTAIASALSTFVRGYLPLSKFWYLRSPHDAEDAVQAVFCKLMEQKLSVYPGRERAFLTKLTVNHCKNQLAAAKRFVPDALDDLILPAEPADRTLYRAVMELPEKYRVVIVLHCMEGYALSEIAGFLHITTSAVSMRLHRARKMLDEQLGRD